MLEPASRRPGVTTRAAAFLALEGEFAPRDRRCQAPDGPCLMTSRVIPPLVAPPHMQGASGPRIVRGASRPCGPARRRTVALRACDDARFARPGPPGRPCGGPVGAQAPLGGQPLRGIAPPGPPPPRPYPVRGLAGAARGPSLARYGASESTRTLRGDRALPPPPWGGMGHARLRLSCPLRIAPAPGEPRPAASCAPGEAAIVAATLRAATAGLDGLPLWPFRSIGRLSSISGEMRDNQSTETPLAQNNMTKNQIDRVLCHLNDAWTDAPTTPEQGSREMDLILALKRAREIAVAIKEGLPPWDE